MAAKLTLSRLKYDSSSQCLTNLHWLPFQQRIEFKILMLMYNSLDQHVPLYLQECLKRKETRRQELCSQSAYKVLEVPATKRKTFADGAFGIAGPKLWNTLPTAVKQASNIDRFETSLKTYLFKKHLWKLHINTNLGLFLNKF